MLTADGCRARRRRLWSAIAHPVDWILIADPLHLMYFANYSPSPFVFRTQDAAALLILGRDDSSILVADNLLRQFADLAHVDEVVAPDWYRGVATAPPRQPFLVENTLELLGRCPRQRFGIEMACVPAGILEGLRSQRGDVAWVEVGPIIRELRRRKDPDELALLRRSMQAGEAGMAAALRAIQPGMTELEAYLVVQNAVFREAGDQVLVYGDFVAGRRCEKGGGPPGLYRIERGDLILLDFSAIIHQYRGDFANTFVCGGPPTSRQRDLHRACLDAMQAGEKLLRPGVTGQDVDRAVRGCFETQGLGANFHSHVGHGLGLGHPEPPFLVPKSSDTLVAGDVVTLEPGQFVPGVAGMRYERNYLITENGYELLSHHALTIS
jgi:Xaa-Pro aminopeptidase